MEFHIRLILLQLPVMKELKILFLEDSADDAEIAGRILKKAGLDFDFKLVDTEHEYKTALEDYVPDVILADHSIYQFNSSEALQLFQQTGLKIPFILVTGTVSEEFAVRILKQGADDYLLKSNLARLPNAILNSLDKYRLAREREHYLHHIVANEALMKEAEELSSFGSWEADPNTGEMKWSNGIYRIYGYAPGTIKPGQDIIMNHIHPDDRSAYLFGLYSVLPANDRYSGLLRIIDKKGTTRSVSLTIAAKRDKDHQLMRLLGFMQDVTQKTTLEKELELQTQQRQNLVTEATLRAQEKERNELGRELHDNINQVLACVTLYLKMGLNTDDLLKKQEIIEKSMEHTQYAIEEIRKLSRSLVSPSLGDLGLMSAIQNLTDQFNATGELEIATESNLDDDKERLDKNLEVMLYRIVQEQLNNIRKYAKTKTVDIEIYKRSASIQLTITDNGIGFDASQKKAGIGLCNIKSRVEYYSGIMNLITSPGKGCRLEIKVPLK